MSFGGTGLFPDAGGDKYKFYSSKIWVSACRYAPKQNKYREMCELLNNLSELSVDKTDCIWPTASCNSTLSTVFFFDLSSSEFTFLSAAHIKVQCKQASLYFKCCLCSSEEREKEDWEFDFNAIVIIMSPNILYKIQQNA